MLPTGQRLDALKPGGDALVLGGNIKTEFSRGVVEVSDERQIGYGRLPAQDERRGGEPLIHYAEIVVDAPFKEREHRRVAGRLGEIAQEAIGTEKAVDLLIVENDPAQRLQAFILASRLEFSRALGS